MTPPDEEHLVEKVIHFDNQVFEQVLAALASRDTGSNAERGELYSAILSRLSDGDGLGSVEKGRRAMLILRHVPKNRDVLEGLAGAASDWSAEIRNAVARCLPPELKQIAYIRQSARAPTSQSGAADKVSGQHGAASPSGSVDEDNGRGEVLLLGTAQEQESNRTQLERLRFRPRRAASVNGFRNLLTSDVSGIVVGQSWWGLIAPEEHGPFVDNLLEYSTFAWMKIDTRGCSCAKSIEEKCRAVRYCNPTFKRFVLGETSALAEVELRSLRDASEIIEDHRNVRLSPAEVDQRQAQVLIAAVSEHVQSRHIISPVRLQNVDTSLMRGGRSDALIIRVQPDDGGLPFIAKLDDISRLRIEMERFQRFIAPWDNLLRPQLHYHNNSGTIIFGLVAGPEDPSVPAPTLEDTLEEVLFSENGAVGDHVPAESDLLGLIDRTIDKVRSLNEQRCEDQSVESLAWTGVSPLDSMLASGIEWHFPTLPDGRHPLEMRHRAVEYLRQMRDVATVHGDLHLGNVLVRDGREPFLIDYAYAGPGHPCFDLVRFESALMYYAFRVTDDEQSIRDLVGRTISGSTTLDEVQEQFPTLCTSKGNRLAIHSSISARAGCLKLLTQYNGAYEQYLAMKLVVACQSLCIQKFQNATVRATIHATARLLAEDADR